MVRHTEAADDESTTEEYKIEADEAKRFEFDDISEGDAIDVVYEPKRGSRQSKTISGVVTHVAQRDGVVSKINADTGEEYDDGTPKTFEFEPTNNDGGYVRSHGKKRVTGLGEPTVVIVRTIVEDDEDDDTPSIDEAAANFDDVDPVEQAFGEASNDEETVCVRFVCDRDDGVSFDISDSPIYHDWYRPDFIIAEHFGVVDAIEDALAVLRDEIDLRSLSEGRVGAFRFDRKTGDLVDISLYGVDVPAGNEYVVKARMGRCIRGDGGAE